MLDSRLNRSRLEFLVQWRGYSAEHNSWEPEGNLANAPTAIREFYQRHPGAPRRIDRATLSTLSLRPRHSLTTDPALDGTYDQPSELALFRSALRGG